MRIPKVSLTLSTIAHAAFIIIILGIGGYFALERGGGSGGSEGAFVSVWVADSSGKTYSGVSQPITRKRSSLARPAKKTSSKVEEKLQSTKSLGSGQGAGGGTGSGVGGPSGGGAGTGDDGNKVLARIWKHIDRRKYYPMIAKRQKLEGKPKVTFELNDDGSVRWVKLTTSCGSKILDDAALETVRRASPLPYYPKTITLALKYSISD